LTFSINMEPMIVLIDSQSQLKFPKPLIGTI
jgi:hypothetical protein